MNMQRIKPHLPWITLLVLTAVVGAVDPNFLRPANLLSLAGDIVPLFIMALGLTFAIYIGGIDLSVGSIYAVAAIVGAMAGLILLEPDLGTAVLLLTTAAVLLFLAGLAWRYVLGVVLAGLPVIYFLVVSAPYRARRLTAFLDPEADALGSGFQVLQSLIAVGSGGITGLGLGGSLQKLYYLPHPHSDFVYAIVCEELGMVGGLGLLAAFGVFVWRGVRAGLEAPDRFGSYLAWGITALIATQALFHVSVSLALLPTKGIPLPFISYGGSSLVSTLAACGILLNVSQHG